MSQRLSNELEIKGTGAPWLRVILRSCAELCDCTVSYGSGGSAIIEGSSADKEKLAIYLYEVMHERINHRSLFNGQHLKYIELLEQEAKKLHGLVERGGYARGANRND